VSFTCRKILRCEQATEGRRGADFIALKNPSSRPVLNREPWVQWQANHYTTEATSLPVALHWIMYGLVHFVSTSSKGMCAADLTSMHRALPGDMSNCGVRERMCQYCNSSRTGQRQCKQFETPSCRIATI
jgi:hypothetical protein